MTIKEGDILVFTGEEKIIDILACHPEAAEILYSHGIGCVGCSFSHMETLKQGMASHGFDEDDVERVLQDLNEAAEDLGLIA